MSVFFGIIENHCLYLLFKFMRKQKTINHTNIRLEYDGADIPPIDTFNKATMMELNNFIRKKTDLRYVEYAVKEFSDFLPDMIEKRMGSIASARYGWAGKDRQRSGREVV
jgi:hypothetical protein